MASICGLAPHWVKRPKRWTQILQAFGCSTLLFASATAEAAEETCRQTPLSQPMGFPTSGAFDSSGNLVIADPVEAAVMYWSSDGILLGRAWDLDWEKDGGERLPLGRVSSLKIGPSGDGALQGHKFFKDEERNELIQVNRDDFLESITRFEYGRAAGPAVGGGPRLLSIEGWQPVMGSGCQGCVAYVAFGDVQFPEKKGPDRYRSAFVLFDEDGIQKIYDQEPLPFLVPSDDERNHYFRRAMSYITSLDGHSVYILRLQETASIIEVRPGAEPRKLPADLPVGFSNPPVLKRNPDFTKAMNGYRQSGEFYRQYEQAAMPQGIYSANGRLFLLGKTAIASGKTSWLFIEIDPDDGTEKARFRLPTSAAHLTVIVGESSLVLLEKGKVELIGEEFAPFMDVTAMTEIPLSWLEGNSSPLANTSQLTECQVVER